MKDNFYFCDFHCHTSTSHDSPAKIKNITAVAKRRGVDAIAVTDHNKTYKGPLVVNGVDIIPGSEITTKEGEHLLAYFIEEDVQKGLPFEEAVSRVHDLGGFVVWAHPLRKRGLIKEEDKKNFAIIDGVETGNAMDSEKERRKTKEICSEFSVVETGGSDSHIEGQIGTGVARTREKITKENFLKVLSEGEVVVRDEISSFRKSNRKLRGPMIFINKLLDRKKISLGKKIFNGLVIKNYLRIVNINLKRIKFNYRDEY